MPAGTVEVDAAQRPASSLVLEPDVLEAHLAAHVAELAAALAQVDRQVEVLEHALEQRHRGLDVDADAEQRLDRPEQPRLQRREGDQRADRDRARGQAGEQVHERGHDGERGLDRGHHPAARHPRADLEVGEPLGLALEAVGQLVAAAHRLAEQDAGDRQRLLHERGDVGHRALARGRDLRAAGCRRGARAARKTA